MFSFLLGWGVEITIRRCHLRGRSSDVCFAFISWKRYFLNSLLFLSFSFENVLHEFLVTTWKTNYRERNDPKLVLITVTNRFNCFSISFLKLILAHAWKVFSQFYLFTCYENIDYNPLLFVSVMYHYHVSIRKVVVVKECFFSTSFV